MRSVALFMMMLGMGLNPAWAEENPFTLAEYASYDQMQLTEPLPLAENNLAEELPPEETLPEKAPARAGSRWMLDSEVAAAGYGCQSGNCQTRNCQAGACQPWGCDAGCCESGVPYPGNNPCYENPQTVGWLSGPYFKAGITHVLGDGFLDEDSQVSYMISLGGRQALGPGLGGRRLFFDVGGSYLSALGETTRNVRGNQVVTQNNVQTVTIVDNAYSVTLEEIRRVGGHAGLGFYFGDMLDDRCADPQLRFGMVVGGRLSHIHGVFNSQQLIPPPVVVPPATSTSTALNAKNDTAGGMYVDLEALLLKRNSPLGDLQWTVDLEFAHDWIDFSNFEQRGLATGALLFGFTLMR